MDRDGLDPHRGKELLTLRQRLPVRAGAPDLLQAGTLHAQERVIDPHHDLADDLQQRRVLQQVVGLVDRPGLGVLQWHDAESGLATGDPGEDQSHGLTGQRIGIGEERTQGPLRIGARFALVGDLHGGRA